MAINKVTKDGEILIDLSQDTVASAADIAAGKVGHLNDGTVVTGIHEGTKEEQAKTMTLGAAAPMTVTPDTGKTLSSVAPSIDETVIKAENIAKDVTILGITGTHTGQKPEQTKTVTPTAAGLTVTPDSGKVLSSVTVNGDVNLVAGNIKSGVNIFGVAGTLQPAKEEQTKTVTPAAAGLTVTPDSGKTLSSVVVEGDADLAAENIKDGVTIFGVTGTYIAALPTLNAPTISLSGSTLSITNPSSNGNFVTGYRIYDGNDLIATVQTTTVDLSTYISEAGSHTVTAKAYGTNFNDSAASNSVTYTVVSGYNVSVSASASFATSYGYYWKLSTDASEAGAVTINDATKGTTVFTGVSEIYASTGADGWGGASDLAYTMGGVSQTPIDGGKNDYAWHKITLTGDVVITGSGESVCLTGDTLVTMADGTEKRIDEIELGDRILSYDWETLTLVPNKVIYTDKDEGKTHTEYDVWTFDDGTVIKTVHRHEFYNVEAGRMKYMDEWVIGEHAYKQDGTTPMLVAHETVVETVQHYKITGERGTNYFANGLLNGDRYCPKGVWLTKCEEASK